VAGLPGRAVCGSAAEGGLGPDAAGSRGGVAAAAAPQPQVSSADAFMPERRRAAASMGQQLGQANRAACCAAAAAHGYSDVLLAALMTWSENSYCSLLTSVNCIRAPAAAGTIAAPRLLNVVVVGGIKALIVVGAGSARQGRLGLGGRGAEMLG